MPELASVSEVETILAQAYRTAPAVSCPLKKALGCILKEAIQADRDLPPFDRVMMDGFAIRASDIGTNDFNIKSQALAGSPQANLPHESGAAIEVMTGAPLPAGADTVIPYEDTSQQGDRFSLRESQSATSGQYVHLKGSDQSHGSVLVAAGTQIRSIEVGIAASAGYHTLTVAQRPRITIFGTGDELVPIEQMPEPHQIRRSNAHAVEAALAHAGFHAKTIGHLENSPGTQADILFQSIEKSDVIIISGAVSKSQRDWIPEALNRKGKCLFHGVAQRPGKPMGFWITSSGCNIFALPGNPVSTLVATHRYIIPFLYRQQGAKYPAPLRLPLAQPFDFQPALTCFLPVQFKEGKAHPSPVNNSGDYAGLAQTSGFIELPAVENHWTAGTLVPFYPWL